MCGPQKKKKKENPLVPSQAEVLVRTFAPLPPALLCIDNVSANDLAAPVEAPSSN